MSSLFSVVWGGSSWVWSGEERHVSRKRIVGQVGEGHLYGWGISGPLDY